MRCFAAVAVVVGFGLPVVASEPGRVVEKAKPAMGMTLPSPHYLEGHPPQYFPEAEPVSPQTRLLKTALFPGRALAEWVTDPHERLEFSRAVRNLAGIFRPSR